MMLPITTTVAAIGTLMGTLLASNEHDGAKGFGVKPALLTSIGSRTGTNWSTWGRWTIGAWVTVATLLDRG